MELKFKNPKKLFITDRPDLSELMDSIFNTGCKVGLYLTFPDGKGRLVETRVDQVKAEGEDRVTFLVQGSLSFDMEEKPFTGYLRITRSPVEVQGLNTWGYVEFES